VTTSPISPDEVRAAAEVHRELGPEYDKAVVESFIERLGAEIDARVDARLAARQADVAPHRGSNPGSRPLAITSIALGIPITAIAAAAGAHPAGFWGILVVWIAIAVINVAYAGFGRR
jgi:hypothetical protein